MEGYLAGTEYALDAYFDEDGRAHVLNVLRHDFAGPEDTSDRLYLTDAALVEGLAPRLTAWLDQVNALVGARSFPVHVELRIDGDVIAPIEFNPLRFAGLGGTDVAYYAVGLRTYQAFLEGDDPDLPALYAAHPGDVFSLSLLTPAPDADLTRPFDYEALAISPTCWRSCPSTCRLWGPTGSCSCAPTRLPRPSATGCSMPTWRPS